MKPATGAFKKALLLEAGLIYPVSHGMLPITERPTAGPDAGLNAIFIKFGRYRVRMALTQNTKETPFKLKKEGDSYLIMRRETPFLRDVTLEKPIVHAPNQAFINLASPCAFDCKFCATPKLKIKFILKPEKVLALIKSAMRSGERFEGIALTSGVLDSERRTVELMVKTIKCIRKEIDPQIPIGVEPYVTNKDYVDQLYNSGATEIKVNVESFDRMIMMAVCPDIDYNRVVSALEYSVSVFGKNKVCSNVLIGLGETDDNVLKGLTSLAEKGVVVNLKPLFMNPYRKRDIVVATRNNSARPNATRILKLALIYRSILEKHNLKTSIFHTMCHKCTGCEIVPQQDV